jgi:hypothetical protein
MFPLANTDTFRTTCTAGKVELLQTNMIFYKCRNVITTSGRPRTAAVGKRHLETTETATI